MAGRNRALGNKGEGIAARFLSRKGYKIIGRNVRTFVGELDIIAKKDSMIVFVEVKTRYSARFGPPHLSVTWRKRRKLIQCALCYLKMRRIDNAPWQIDIVSIELDRLIGFVRKIEHFKNAVSE